MENEEDTSYFDSRLERYSHHEFDDSDTDDSPVLSSSFASYSPQYRKHCYNNNNNNRNNNYGSDESNSSLNDSGLKLALDIRNLNVSNAQKFDNCLRVLCVVLRVLYIYQQIIRVLCH